MYMETDTIEFMIHVPQYWNAIGNPPGTLGRSTSVLTCMETDTLGFMIHVPQYWIHIHYFGRVQLWCTCYAWSTQSITIYRMRRSDQDHRHALKLCGRARVFLPSAFAPVLLQTACVA